MQEILFSGLVERSDISTIQVTTHFSKFYLALLNPYGIAMPHTQEKGLQDLEQPSESLQTASHLLFEFAMIMQ